jgi:hypothetical protein
MTVTFRPDPVAIAEVLSSPTGLVGNHVINVATIVQLRAQANAPVKTGKLKASIVKRIQASTPTSVAVEVGVWTVPYAYWVHEGNDPGGGWIYPTHTRADGGVPMLKFPGAGGEIIFRPRVRATKPRRFLTDALGSVVAEL